MKRRKTLLQSTDEPVPIAESDFSPQPDEPDEFELEVRDNPQVPIPSARPVPRPTLAASPGNSRQTIAAAQPGPRQTIAESPTDVRETVTQRPAAAAPAMPYRSVNRPPMGLLIALDDGSTDSGEEWRIRRTRIIIGRTAGDVVIPHDVDMSGEHAEISCSEKDGGYEWQLKDLKSTNGTFLRAQRFVLRNGKEVLLGGRRYLFRHPGIVGESVESGRHGVRVTQAYQPPPSDVEQQLTARLIELTAAGEGREFLLGGEPSLFGSDAGCCRHVVSGDPFLDPEHARFYQDNRGRWVIEDRGSLNGLWVRIERVTLDRASEFQLGGQRFRFRVP